MMRLVLASASPRRAELMRQIALPFEVLPSSYEEPSPEGWAPEHFVVDLALNKARSVQRVLHERGEADNAIVIGADTVVCREDAILGKPSSTADAVQMLRGLSGHRHQVYTGLALVAVNGRECSGYEMTEVKMGELSEADIAAYVASGEPLDKAGSYGIQGSAGRFIESVEGCYYNVVGLPLARLCALLNEMGYGVTAAIAANEMQA
ncbi:MAG: septum formation protein [Candidatus Latescibacterota bacterium]|jgi:septum formation protein